MSEHCDLTSLAGIDEFQQPKSVQFMSFCPANVLPEQNLTTGSMYFAYIIPGLETEGTQDVCASSSWKKKHNM